MRSHARGLRGSRDRSSAPFLDQGMDMTGEQIDPRHQGQGAVALVLVIAHHGRADAGNWAGDPARWYRSPESLVSRRKRRSRGSRHRCLGLGSPRFQLGNASSPFAGRHREFRPFSARTRDRAAPGSSVPCGSSLLARPISCRPFLGPASPGSDARRMIHVAGLTPGI